MSPQYIAPLFLMLFSLTAMADEPTVVRDHIRMGVAYANIALPDECLQRPELDRWCELLELSDAQSKYLYEQYEVFVAQHNAAMVREVPAHLEKSAEASAITTEFGFGSPQRLRAFEELDRSAGRVRRILADVELDLVNALTPVLSEAQTSRLDILRHEAKRRQCRTLYIAIRWANIELRRDVWEAMDHASIPGADAAMIESMLIDYERELTHRFCAQADVYWSRNVKLARLFVDREMGKIDIASSHRRYADVMEEFVAASQRVASLNESTVTLIADSVSPQTAAMFQQHARAAAFPDLYPDPTSLHALFDAIRHDATLDIESREATAAIGAAYAEAHERECRTLEAFCIDWGERLARGESGYQNQFRPAAVEKASRSRAELSRDWLDTLIETIGIDAVMAHAEHVPARIGLARTPVAGDDD